jgi:hypothetical protein
VPESTHITGSDNIAGVGVMCAMETLSIPHVSRRTGLFSVDGLDMYVGEVGSQRIVTVVAVVFHILSN